MFDKLTKEQQVAVETEGNVLVTACPGSGKTKVLTQKVGFELEKLESSKKFVLALTFTNRAAEEVQRRLDNFDINTDNLWIGTIHAFCLEWILRPYAGCSSRLKDGFIVIDEYSQKNLIWECKKEQKMGFYDQVNVKPDLNGKLYNENAKAKHAARQYHRELVKKKLIDYDLILYISYMMLKSNSFIAQTLANMFEIICVDEYQDIQETQYGIIGMILKASHNKTRLFFVGDPDQAIYSSLGGVAKTLQELESEFSGVKIKHLNLTGNFRSSQRIIDFYSNFQTVKHKISAKNERVSGATGLITLHKGIEISELHNEIARLIQFNIKNGVPEEEICIIAPQWQLIYPLAKDLRLLLPGVNFDAPDITPFKRNKNNIWFKVARIFLTDTSPKRYLTRIRWANEIIREFEAHFSISFPEEYRTGRSLLRAINSIKTDVNDLSEYLDICFSTLLFAIGLQENELLKEQRELLMDSVSKLQLDPKYDFPVDVENAKKMFMESRGIVINTCHGVKGEEYRTVIAYGLLNDYIPFRYESDRLKSSKKLLYVICSRAKENLHLFAESGRKWSGEHLVINNQLNEVEFIYDEIEI